MRDKKIIIIDEFFMLSQTLLSFIDKRLKQIMHNQKPFGGLVIVLVGDPGQLPPVNGNCLWNKKAKHGTENFQGYIAYRNFTIAIRL